MSAVMEKLEAVEQQLDEVIVRINSESGVKDRYVAEYLESGVREAKHRLYVAMTEVLA